MKPLLIIILKVIATVFCVIAFWMHVFAALILWDTKILEHNTFDQIWKRKNNKEI